MLIYTRMENNIKKSLGIESACIKIYMHTIGYDNDGVDDKEGGRWPE